MEKVQLQKVSTTAFGSVLCELGAFVYNAGAL